MKKRNTLLVLLLILTGCSSNRKSDSLNENSRTVKTPDTFITVDVSKNSITGTEIRLNEILTPSRIKISRDLLFISCFKCDTMIYTYSLPDLKLVNKFGTKGNGPDDFLFPSFTNVKNDTVSIWGYSNLRKIKQFTIDKKGNWRHITDYDLKDVQAYNQLSTTDSFVFYNGYPPSLSLKKIQLNTMKEEKTYEFKMERDKSESFFEINRGNLYVSKNIIAYPYYFKHRIDFFDADFNVINSYNKDNESQKHINIGFPNNNMVFYITAFAGDHFFFTINHAKDASIRNNNICRLEIFSNKGKCINQASLSPAIDIFVVDEADSILYGYNYEIPDSFFKYELSSVLKDKR